MWDFYSHVVPYRDYTESQGNQLWPEFYQIQVHFRYENGDSVKFPKNNNCADFKNHVFFEYFNILIMLNTIYTLWNLCIYSVSKMSEEYCVRK